MRLASLRILPLLLLASVVVAGCIIVIEDDDHRPPWRPDGGIVDGGPPDAFFPPDAPRPRPDAFAPDGGTIGVFPVELGCESGPALAPSNMTIRGDLAEITVEHGGGCGQHEYRICWNGAFLESFPVQARLAVQHRSDDPCDAWLTRVLTIDLARLRDAYRDAYQTRNGAILIDFVPGEASGRYTF